MGSQDMITYIITRGRWRSARPLVWNGGLTVPMHPRHGWTINPISLWPSNPIAYRDGVEIWPSRRSVTPFAIRRHEDDWNFRYLETAMSVADRMWPQSDK